MRRALSVFVVLTLLGAAAVVGCTTLPKPRAPAAGEAHLRVMTWNVNFGVPPNDDDRLVLDHGDAELVLLQESTPGWERWAARELRDLYPHQQFHQCCRAGGLAVLSKHPIRSLEIIDAPSGWFPAARVVVDSPVGPLQVLSVHLHPPVSDKGDFVSGYFTTDAVRHDELSRFLIELEPELPTLVVGDFNERRGPAIRALEDMGFSCALDRFVSAPITWRWRLPLVQLEQNLDHVFTGPGLKAIDAFVVDAGRSDHLPVIAVVTRG